MKPKYKPQQVVFAINIYNYKDDVLKQDFYRIEKVIIESVTIDINIIEYWFKDIKTGIGWQDCVPENMVFTTKELAAKQIIKLCEL